MAVVWIDTVDISTAKRLVQRLVCDFGGESVMLAAAGDEVRLTVEFESGEVVGRALDALERLLDETGIHGQVSYGARHDRALPIASCL